MNRPQRRAYQKELKKRERTNGRHDEVQVCPVCGNRSEFVAIPAEDGKCVPVCVMCRRAAGPARLGLIPHTYVKLVNNSDYAEEADNAEVCEGITPGDTRTAANM